MIRGCIATGEIRCDGEGCHRVIQHGERYLLSEGEEGEALRLCVDCCLGKGYSNYVAEQGEKALTFFPAPPGS